MLDSSVAYVPQSSVLTDLSFYNARGKPRLIAGNTKGEVAAPTGSFWAFDPRQLGWREVGTLR